MCGEAKAKLAVPPMLMFHRIITINIHAGHSSIGLIEAGLHIKEDLCYLDCHFINDPVMPGCLGLDAMWQLVGFFLGWDGNPGKGRALGVAEVKFTGEVTQDITLAKYVIHMKKIMKKGETSVGLADGMLLADNKEIYKAKNLKVGLFKGGQ